MVRPAVSVAFFDAAGTLFDVNGSVADLYLRHAEKYGVKQLPEVRAAIDSAFHRAFREAPPPVFAVRDPAEIKRCERLWWFDIVHHVFYRVGMFEGFDQYFEEVFEAFGGPDYWSLFPETISVLKRLKDHGIEIGIISNFDSRLFTILRGLGLSDLVETVTIASLAQAAKPSPKIFAAALEKHAADPREAVHVGDSLRDDVGGAAAAGLHAVHLNRSGGGSLVGPSGHAHSIRSLEELVEVVHAL
jgi:putative hydrolase of the HAD superfamily